MKKLTSNIIANGIRSLLQENDAAFKKSLVNCLSLKLNESIKESEREFAVNLLKSKNKLPESVDLKYFMEFLENYDSIANNKLKLKNQTVININESELSDLKDLFDCLNSKNRQIMISEILESPQKLKQNLNFYRKAKGITK